MYLLNQHPVFFTNRFGPGIYVPHKTLLYSHNFRHDNVYLYLVLVYVAPNTLRTIYHHDVIFTPLVKTLRYRRHNIIWTCRVLILISVSILLCAMHKAVVHHHVAIILFVRIWHHVYYVISVHFQCSLYTISIILFVQIWHHHVTSYMYVPRASLPSQPQTQQGSFTLHHLS